MSNHYSDTEFCTDTLQRVTTSSLTIIPYQPPDVESEPTVVVNGCTLKDFYIFLEENPDMKGVCWFEHGQILYIDLTQNYVSVRVIEFIQDEIRPFGARSGQKFKTERDVPATYSANFACCPELNIALDSRRRNGILNGNIHVEIGYAQTLTHLLRLRHLILNDDEPTEDTNHCMAYIVIKFSHPFDPTTPGQFQAVAIVFLRDNPEGSAKPAAIHSFGTLSLSQAVFARIVDVLCNDDKFGQPGILEFPRDNSILHGHGIDPEDPPCTEEHANRECYQLVIPGSVMFAADRNTLTSEIDPPLPPWKDFVIPLYQVQHAAAEGYEAQMQGVSWPEQVIEVNAARIDNPQARMLQFQHHILNPADHLML